ncbi:RidA family protein [Desulfitobacterium hafniense]|uniref:Reactive intermediate/imine deaminase n=5 Tax=root TaxID=1 RepID=Q24XW8_DESHY|nr:RidA family protein [Desulfitobacterium hafniense]ACL20491.1 endoribonuclease L-PSP [Desulfitobacterium hafniense DCB-2]EHL04314.1 putative endoribonuclease L-PSP [Desulfitobacterium hafniense DP7]KTE92375.1 reactive intermediate/imine deaminase [Desulfitobacterium hafniense]MEA5025988.1 RidA family protein [Desulfitobacterium hafniense]CDX01344.1 RutC protein PH0854 [Desulfitobacterium hafniense]
MSLKVLNTEKAPGAIGPYSQGIQAGNLIFTSGQLPLNPTTGELTSDIRSATKQSLENVKNILESAGSSMDKIVKTLIFLKDMNDFAEMNEVYGSYFPTNPPARSAVQVARLPKDAIIEIEAIALV